MAKEYSFPLLRLIGGASSLALLGVTVITSLKALFGGAFLDVVQCGYIFVFAGLAAISEVNPDWVPHGLSIVHTYKGRGFLYLLVGLMALPLQDDWWVMLVVGIFEILMGIANIAAWWVIPPEPDRGTQMRPTNQTKALSSDSKAPQPFPAQDAPSESNPFDEGHGSDSDSALLPV